MEAQSAVAEQNATDWNRPGGGYDEWKKADPERDALHNGQPLSEQWFQKLQAKKPLDEQ